VGIVEAFSVFLHTHACPVDAAAVGGSCAHDSGDTLSDVDLFVYCQDHNLHTSISCVCDWARKELGNVSSTYGPFLRDEFGIGYRFMQGWQVPLEIFFVPESAWWPSPSSCKARLIYQDGTAGQTWQARIQGCGEVEFDQLTFVTTYLQQQVLVWFSKALKYLARGECAGAGLSCIRIIPALFATQQHLDHRTVFDPDFALRKLQASRNPELSRTVRDEMIEAVIDPARSVLGLIRQAEQLVRRLPRSSVTQTLADIFHSLEGRAEGLLQQRMIGLAGPSHSLTPGHEDRRSSDGTVEESVEMHSAELRELNRAHWEEVSTIHVRSPYYDVDNVVSGQSSISAIERSELGELSGKSGVHLQCGIGLDTISLSRCGADMLGIDFSAKAVESAQRFARQCGVSARFAVGDVLDAGSLPPQTFDFAYASHGVLRWLVSLDTWARNVAGLVRPGGFVFVFEIHPLVYRLAAADGDRAQLMGDYFDRAPKRKERTQTHSGNLEGIRNSTIVHLDWTIADILSSLIHNGFAIRSFNEHAGTSYSRKGLLPRRLDNLWYAESASFPIPLSFSVKAMRSPFNADDMKGTTSERGCT